MPARVQVIKFKANGQLLVAMNNFFRSSCFDRIRASFKDKRYTANNYSCLLKSKHN